MSLKFLGISNGSGVDLTATQDGLSVTRVDENWGNAPAAISRKIAPTVLDGSAQSVDGGRVTVFEDATKATVDSIIITGQPAAGKVTVNPDQTISLVLTGETYSGSTSFSYQLTRTGGSVENTTCNITVAAPVQAAGWGVGNHYMLETDANDKVVVETGATHRKVYISADLTARASGGPWTAADIAAAEGITEAQVTDAFLEANPTYGGDAANALEPSIGIDIWYRLTWFTTQSHWLLFERGYTYPNLGRIVGRGNIGESPLNPTHITSYGTGPRPVLETSVLIYQDPAANIVITEVEFDSIDSLSSEYVLISDCTISGTVNAQTMNTFTIRNSSVSYATRPNPVAPVTWSDGGTGPHGMFSQGANGVLVENVLFHHNGWGADYKNPEDIAFGQPPSLFTHNVYIQYNTKDTTFRNCIASRGSSYGAQLRGGAFVEDSLFLDNGAALSLLGGNYKDFGFVGNFSLANGNIITSAGYKFSEQGAGAADWGIVNAGLKSVFVDNLVSHMANPDDVDEKTWKENGTQPLDYTTGGGTVKYEDTIVHNWEGSVFTRPEAADRNPGGTTPATADTTTIQRYAVDYLDVSPALISDGTQLDGYYNSTLLEDLCDDWLADYRAGTLNHNPAKAVVDYFKTGFGIPITTSSATSHDFIPSALGEGVRWDNRLNWSNQVTPSNTHTVDLRGNNVTTYTTFNGTVLLNGGTLTIYGGKFSGSIVGPGTVILENAGQRDATLSGGATETDNR